MARGPVLVMGASGMLGHVLLRTLAARGLAVRGTVRGEGEGLPPALRRGLVPRVDATRPETVEAALDAVGPAAVVNCVGVVKQLAEARDPVRAIQVNALFPHQLAAACRARGARLVQVSTDCVFSGARGGYREADPPDPVDLYGRTKLLGEVAGPGAVTLRTSIIGHELGTRHGLLEWFLSQRGPVSGHARAIWSGLPTVELAQVVADQVLPHPELEGVWHVSAAAISKHDLLRLVAAEYGLATAVAPAAEPACDRSLDSTRFRAATGWVPAPWPELLARMHRDHLAARA